MDITEKLYDLAVQTRKNAYAPYSHFMVGAAIYSTNNNFFGGCNVENASYPCGTCAEAGAISQMIAGGSTEIAQIMIVADMDNILPCGNCLQKIAEFANADTLVHSADLKHNIRTYKLTDLLPQSFSLKDVANV